MNNFWENIALISPNSIPALSRPFSPFTPIHNYSRPFMPIQVQFPNSVPVNVTLIGVQVQWLFLLTGELASPAAEFYSNEDEY